MRNMITKLSEGNTRKTVPPCIILSTAKRFRTQSTKECHTNRQRMSWSCSTFCQQQPWNQKGCTGRLSTLLVPLASQAMVTDHFHARQAINLKLTTTDSAYRQYFAHALQISYTAYLCNLQLYVWKPHGFCLHYVQLERTGQQFVLTPDVATGRCNCITNPTLEVMFPMMLPGLPISLLRSSCCTTSSGPTAFV